MESPDNFKLKAYKSNGAKGYYYYISKNGDSRVIPRQDTSSFTLDLEKYDIISVAEAKEVRASIRKSSLIPRGDKISYDGVNVDEVVVRISIKNIKDTAAKYDFVLTTKAVDAYRNVLSNCSDLDTKLAGHRLKHPDMNHIDFDTRSKDFIIGYKKRVKVDDLSDQLSPSTPSD